MELKYECIRSEYLVQEASSSYQVGKGFFYENIILHKTVTISKPNTSVIEEHINFPRRSMEGIFCLFTGNQTAGTRDSKKFVNPNIKSISINIDGMPNKLYSNGMVPTDFWESIKKRLIEKILLIKQKEFYTNNKFALWIDLRTYPDGNIHGNGCN